MSHVSMCLCVYVSMCLCVYVSIPCAYTKHTTHTGEEHGRHHHTSYVTSSYILCHIIIHPMSHHHTSYVTSSYIRCHIIIQVKSLADISNFANHFTNEMVSNLRPGTEGETCDVFSDFRYVMMM